MKIAYYILRSVWSHPFELQACRRGLDDRTFFLRRREMRAVIPHRQFQKPCIIGTWLWVGTINITGTVIPMGTALVEAEAGAIITATFLVAEFTGALYTNSLALSRTPAIC